MWSVAKLPMAQKAAALRVAAASKPLSAYQAACLSCIVPHGFTDVWLHAPQRCAICYGASALVVPQPWRVKICLLLMFSVVHLRHDIPARASVQLAYATALHFSWLWFPAWALPYLAVVHTALHYYRMLPFLTAGRVACILAAQGLVYLLLRRVGTVMTVDAAIPVVIGHVLASEGV